MIDSGTGSRRVERAYRIAQAQDRGAIRQFQFHECTDLRGRVKRPPNRIATPMSGYARVSASGSKLLSALARFAHCKASR